MRNAFADEITQLAAVDKRVVLLSGDIGNKLFDNFKKIDKDRFYNCGVAEANMMGVAAGMALSGLRPIIYTITPFTTTRCFEQIRVDVCYHRAPVIIVGTGSGLSYAELGPTHHSLEDMAILRTLPGMCVLAPCDVFELRAALRVALQQDRPVYIRIGKKGEPNIHPEPPVFAIGKALTLRHGTDVILLGSGTVMSEVLKAIRHRIVTSCR
jgi:transketolase